MRGTERRTETEKEKDKRKEITNMVRRGIEMENYKKENTERERVKKKRKKIQEKMRLRRTE